MKYWLMKSEPKAFSIDDLQRLGVAPWDGVRNYQARNMMRDEMQVNDGVIFYHSNCDPPGIAGIAKVVRTAYPDFTAFDPRSKHYDPKSSPAKPIWYMVDVTFVSKAHRLISLQTLRQCPELNTMFILRKGNRLSITPISTQEWRVINQLMLK